MRIQYSSDVHLEFDSKLGKHFFVSPNADVIVFAGDIHTNPASLAKFFGRIRRQGYDKPIIYVFGNHEIYNHEFHEIKKEYKEKLKDLVTVLDNELAVIDGVSFLGTCLYSDLSNPLDAVAAVQCVTDFRVVKYGDHRLLPKDWTEEHRRAVAWLEEALAAASSPTVVVTHFAPSKQLTAPQFKASRSNAAFSTELYYLIKKYSPKLWIYGHDHNRAQDRRIGTTRVICNQWGYKHEGFLRETILVEI